MLAALAAAAAAFAGKLTRGTASSVVSSQPVTTNSGWAHSSPVDVTAPIVHTDTTIITDSSSPTIQPLAGGFIESDPYIDTINQAPATPATPAGVVIGVTPEWPDTPSTSPVIAIDSSSPSIQPFHGGILYAGQISNTVANSQPYVCNVAIWDTPTSAHYDGASFATKAELGEHLRTAHGYDVYVCPVGDEYFYSEYNLAAHMRFTHPQLTYTDAAYVKYRSTGYAWNGQAVVYVG